MVAGVGVHSGAHVRLVLTPAPPHTGILFVRTDVRHADNRILAHADNVNDTRNATTLANRAGVAVATVEHLMSACAGLGVDDLVVEVDGPEIPIVDGSTAPFIQALLNAGIKRSTVAKSFIRILEPIEVRMGAKSAALLPAEGFPGLVLDVTIRFNDPAIGVQRRRLELSEHSYLTDIADARAFGFLSDIESLRKAGVGLGASLTNTIIVDSGVVVNPEGLRFDDEFVRHKMQDALGDLALAGAPIIGRFVADQPGHALNARLVRALLDTPEAWRWTDNPREGGRSQPRSGPADATPALPKQTLGGLQFGTRARALEAAPPPASAVVNPHQRRRMALADVSEGLAEACGDGNHGAFAKRILTTLALSLRDPEEDLLILRMRIGSVIAEAGAESRRASVPENDRDVPSLPEGLGAGLIELGANLEAFVRADPAMVEIEAARQRPEYNASEMGVSRQASALLSDLLAEPRALAPSAKTRVEEVLAAAAERSSEAPSQLSESVVAATLANAVTAGLHDLVATLAEQQAATRAHNERVTEALQRQTEAVEASNVLHTKALEDKSMVKRAKEMILEKGVETAIGAGSVVVAGWIALNATRLIAVFEADATLASVAQLLRYLFGVV